MKTKNIVILIIVLTLIGAAGFTAINGLSIGNYSIKSINDSIKLGLDIKGGVYVILEAETDAKGEQLVSIMEQTREVIRRRIDAMGLTEPNIVLEGEKRIRIELPGVKNAEEAIQSIGKTAQLTFVMSNDEVVLTGNDIKNASMSFDPKTNEPVVSLEMNSKGVEAFRLATKEASKLPAGENYIAIVLDEEVISAPRVSNEIPNGKAVISGSFDVDSAANLAALIRGGSLPVNLKEVQTQAIGATLGMDSLNTSVNAAKIGVILVLIFMLIFYRVPGIVADISLILYILIVMFVFVGLNATLTLPGVAGLILSVGMAVDANVIIFERIKEELRNGKTIRASIDSGFSKALTTIMDSNITTFIAALVLYYFGLGPIKGFAVTLMIGILASMFTAVFSTKMLLKLIVNLGQFRNTKLFGA